MFPTTTLTPLSPEAHAAPLAEYNHAADPDRQRERQYFRTHARVDYPRFRARGLPLGSGAVEAAGKHLVQLRMKRAGARRPEDGGKGVRAARCRLVSHRPLAAENT